MYERTYPKKATNPIKAIRLFCCECMGADRRSPKLKIPSEDIRGCTDPDCPLYDFRFGKNPHRKKVRLSEERKAALRKGRQISSFSGIVTG